MVTIEECKDQGRLFADANRGLVWGYLLCIILLTIGISAITGGVVMLINSFAVPLVTIPVIGPLIRLVVGTALSVLSYIVTFTLSVVFHSYLIGRVATWMEGERGKSSTIQAVLPIYRSKNTSEVLKWLFQNRILIIVIAVCDNFYMLNPIAPKVFSTLAEIFSIVGTVFFFVMMLKVQWMGALFYSRLNGCRPDEDQIPEAEQYFKANGSGQVMLYIATLPWSLACLLLVPIFVMFPRLVMAQVFYTIQRTDLPIRVDPCINLL